MRKFIWLAVVALALSPMVIATPDYAVLDGTSWKLDVEPDSMAQKAGETQFKQTLTFADGKITLSDPKIGFEASPYSVTNIDKKNWTFKAERTSGGEGSSIWTGIVHDNNIEGKLVWTKNNGDIYTYNFKGNKLD